jgi:hypothetical protein
MAFQESGRFDTRREAQSAAHDMRDVGFSGKASSFVGPTRPGAWRVIQMDQGLPCAAHQPRPAASAPWHGCGQPTTRAFITPAGGDSWELLPLCPAHLAEVVAARAADDTPPGQA